MSVIAEDLRQAFFAQIKQITGQTEAVIALRIYGALTGQSDMALLAAEINTQALVPKEDQTCFWKTMFDTLICPKHQGLVSNCPKGSPQDWRLSEEAHGYHD